MTNLARGALIGERFEIHHPVAGGGMGTVYRARDRETGRAVALKICHRAARGSRDAERFRREAEILEALRHPFIVSFVAHGETETGDLFLAMEWLTGETLAQRLARGPLRLAETVELARRVAIALRDAHARGIVHRDVKPSNLFLSDGRLDDVRLLDFGIASDLASREAITRTGTVVGTPAYMAPEQASGQGDVGPAADVFSLGCVLYECLAGEPAFAGEHVSAVMAKILFGAPAPVETRRSGLPAALARLIGRALAKSADSRPPNAEAFLADVEALPPMPHEEATVATTGGHDWSPGGEDELQHALMSVIVAAPLAAGDPPRPAVDNPRWRAGLPLELARMGAEAAWLRGGSLVAVVSGASTATDQVAIAARSAVLIKKRWPGAEVAVATGRGMAREGALPIGEVFDQALDLLEGWRGVPSTGVWVGSLTISLLRDRRFVVLPIGEGFQLEERKVDLDAGPAPLLGKATPFVGRDHDLAFLLSLVHNCIDEGQPRAALVTAASGAGKSRLRLELVRRLEARHERITLVSAAGDPTISGTPYGVVGQVLRQLWGLTPDLCPDDQRARLLAGLGRLEDLGLAERVRHGFAEICQVPPMESERGLARSPRGDRNPMDQELGQAFDELIEGEAASRPLLLVVDDLQWADVPSVKLLQAAFRSVRDRPFTLIGFARPEIRDLFPRLWRSHGVHELALSPLSRASSDRLIEHALGAGAAAGVGARIAAQAEGNALLLEELIRAAAADSGDPSPRSVLAMHQVGLSRLDPLARRALLFASLFGCTFWQGGVLMMLGHRCSVLALEEALRALTAAELIERVRDGRFPSEVEYRFRQPLVRDAAYALLSEDQRAVGHRLAAEFLERAGRP